MEERIEFKPGVRRTPPALVILTPEQNETLRQHSSNKKRRDEEKKAKTPTYNLTWEQIQKIKYDAAREAVRDIMELTLGFPTMVLHDKHGWRHKRLDAFIDDVLNLYDSYEKGYLSLEDIRKVLAEEGDIRIEKKEIIRRYKK